MSGPRDTGPGKGPGKGSGRRKDGAPFKPGNTREDGGYEVGKNRPPPEHQFRTGDGRKRGLRPKGVENADSFFERELKRPITVREDGRERRVTKGQGIDVRLIHKAGNGDNKSIEMVDQRRRRIVAEKEETARRYHTLSDHEILETFLRERSEELGIDPTLFGDPAPEHPGDPNDG